MLRGFIPLVFQISKYNQTAVYELQNMFSQCLYLPKRYVVCEDYRLVCVCVCVCIWNTKWMNCLKIIKIFHVFYPPNQTAKRKVLAVTSFWTYTEYMFCLVLSTHFLTCNLEHPISERERNRGLVLVGDKKFFSFENCPDRLWAPSSIIFNHHCWPLHKKSRGQCV